MTKTTLKVTGMTCQHCVHAVTQALEGVDGVRSARVDLDAGRADVEYDESRASTDALVGAVAEEGYSAEPLSV